MAIMDFCEENHFLKIKKSPHHNIYCALGCGDFCCCSGAVNKVQFSCNTRNTELEAQDPQLLITIALDLPRLADFDEHFKHLTSLGFPKSAGF